MKLLSRKKLYLCLCALLLCCNVSLTASASGGPFSVTLNACTIGAEQVVSYTTVSERFADTPGIVEQGYYPGELTVTITGPIVVESGGLFSVGTLAIGGSEASPVIAGDCPEGGLIIVKAGGQLVLTDVVTETTGSGPLIVQEPGGSVLLNAMTVENGLIQWSEPLVKNLDKSPEDVWLEKGTPLTEALLPQSLKVYLESQGKETNTELALSWDLSGYDGRTDGELTLTGSFLSASGQPLLSMKPLTLTVHWYSPSTLMVSKAQWKGDQAPLMQLTVENLPEDVDVWGEVSTDEGVTWTRWDDPDMFFLTPAEPEGTACNFALPDNTPRWFRVVAEDPWEHQYWCSESFYLSPEDAEDPGGNRGGSVSILPPIRVPAQAEETLEPVLVEEAQEPQEPIEEVLEEFPPREEVPLLGDRDELPEETPLPEQTEQPATSPSPVIESDATDAPKDEASQAQENGGQSAAPQATAPQPSLEATPAPTVSPEPLPEPSGTAEPSLQQENPEPSLEPAPAAETASAQAGLFTPLQILLIVGGLVVCAGAGMAVAGIGPFRRKK